MNKIGILTGFIIGILTSLLGTYIFILFFTDYDYITGIESMKSQGQLGKIIAIGSVLDLVVFAILLNLNKEFMARGIVLSIIIMTIITLTI